MNKLENLTNQEFLQELRKRIEQGEISYYKDGKLVADKDMKNALLLSNIEVKKYK